MTIPDFDYEVDGQGKPTDALVRCYDCEKEVFVPVADARFVDSASPFHHSLPKCPLCEGYRTMFYGTRYESGAVETFLLPPFERVEATQ